MINESGTLLEETHYYPFGLTMKGVGYRNMSVTGNKYKFNGIEQTVDLGLNQYDAFFRTMDPQLGRWWQMDPKPLIFESPYVGMGDIPVFKVDPLGDTTINGEYFENNSNGGHFQRLRYRVLLV